MPVKVVRALKRQGRSIPYSVFGLDERIIASNDLDIVVLNTGRTCQCPQSDAACGVYSRVTVDLKDRQYC